MALVSLYDEILICFLTTFHGAAGNQLLTATSSWTPERRAAADSIGCCDAANEKWLHICMMCVLLSDSTIYVISWREAHSWTSVDLRTKKRPEVFSQNVFAN